MGHSPIDVGLAATLVRTGDAAGITPFVRVPEVDAGLIKMMLNLGAQGIVVPHANRESAQAAVRAAWYEPAGIRGSCPAIRAANYGPEDGWDAFQKAANREVLVIPLIEDTATVDDFEALADTPGLDVFFLGPFDYSVSAGVPGADFDHPVMAQTLSRMVEIASRRGKYVMTSIGDRIDAQYGRGIIEKGVRHDQLQRRRARLPSRLPRGSRAEGSGGREPGGGSRSVNEAIPVRPARRDHRRRVARARPHHRRADPDAAHVESCARCVP